MPRDVVSKEKLREWMNAQIQKHEECIECHFGGIMQLQSTDDAGCNWSEPILSCSGQSTAICLPIAQEVVSRARAKFNVA
jgi:hypothetical protein